MEILRQFSRWVLFNVWFMVWSSVRSLKHTGRGCSQSESKVEFVSSLTCWGLGSSCCFLFKQIGLTSLSAVCTRALTSDLTGRGKFHLSHQDLSSTSTITPNVVRFHQMTEWKHKAPLQVTATDWQLSVALETCKWASLLLLLFSAEQNIQKKQRGVSHSHHSRNRTGCI